MSTSSFTTNPMTLKDLLAKCDSGELQLPDFQRSWVWDGDPNKLHDMKSILDSVQIYTDQVLDEFVKNFLSGANRDKLDPYLDHAVQLYLDLIEGEQLAKFMIDNKVGVAAERSFEVMGTDENFFSEGLL